MRVVLIGPPSRRPRIRALLPDGVEIVGEAASLSAARASAETPDAYLVVPAARADDEPLVEPLTPREIQIVELVADGLSNRGIGARLGVSEETVKFHLGSVFGKLGASNRTDAVRRAIRRQLIPL